MKSMIGFLFFLLFMAGLFLAFLQGKTLTPPGAAGGGVALTGVQWRPTYVGAVEIPEDAGLWVQFDVDGSIKGHAGCNSFFGSLEATDDGVKVGSLGSTRMACPEPVMDRESAYLSALQQGALFEVSGERMSCLDADRNLLVEFVASEAGEPE